MSDEANMNTTEIQNFICTSLNDPYFKYVAHPAIQSLKCLPMGNAVIDKGDPNGVENSTPTFEPVSDQLGTYSYLVSAVAAFVIVLGIYGYRRRHHRDNTKGKGHLDDSDVNVSNSLSFEVGGLAPTMDFNPIINPSYTAQGGMEVIARHSYFPVSKIFIFSKIS